MTEPRPFNLMFKTIVGPVEDPANAAYLRPETAQAIFAQFKNVLDTSRQAALFGIAQMGKSFRNEVTPATTPSVRASSSRWSSNTSSSPMKSWS